MKRRRLLNAGANVPGVAAFRRRALRALPLAQAILRKAARFLQVVVVVVSAAAAMACLGACARATTNGEPTQGILPSLKKSPWREDAELVSLLSKQQDASILRISEQKAAQKAAEERAAAERVPPSMYRTAEPPLPEPDLSLPVADVPRVTPAPSPKPKPKQ
jgi:hypothetical protein